MPERLDNRLIGAILITIFVVAVVVKRRQDLWHGPGAEPEIMSIDENDAEMNAAIGKARDSVETFIQALASPKRSRSHLSVK